MLRRVLLAKTLLLFVSPAAGSTLFESIDVDGDGRIRQEDIAQYLEAAHDRFAAVKHDKILEKHKGMLNGKIKAMDANGDGQITAEEAATLDESEFRFSLADGDRNHKLNEQEAMVFIIP